MKSLTDKFHWREGRASLVRLVVNVESFQLCVQLDLSKLKSTFTQVLHLSTSSK